MSPILKKFFLPVICPSSIISIVQQALLVVMPLYVLQIGGSLAESAAILGLKGLGMMLADLPAGLLLSRIGDKRLMLCSAIIFIVALVLMAAFPTPLILMPAAILVGLAYGTWLVARISYITDAAEPNERGRVMALSAGIVRLGNVVGPLIAGFLISIAGYKVTLYFFALNLLLVVWFVALWVPTHLHAVKQNHRWSAITDVIKDNSHSFKTAGVAAVILTLVRSSRALLLPLMGIALMLDESSIGIAISIGAIIDALLFYPAGSLMDRLGRKPIFITSMMVLGVSLILLPLSQGFITLVLVASLMGLGNGISAGVIMTLGSDLAPVNNRGNFIGVWRLLSDIGATSAPIIIGTLLKISSFAIAASSVGILGILGGLYTLKAVNETHKKKQTTE